MAQTVDTPMGTDVGRTAYLDEL